MSDVETSSVDTSSSIADVTSQSIESSPIESVVDKDDNNGDNNDSDDDEDDDYEVVVEEEQILILEEEEEEEDEQETAKKLWTTTVNKNVWIVDETKAKAKAPS